MELGMIGLGRMGGNMALRLSKGGHNVVGYDPNQQVVQDYVKQGISGASSLEDLIGQTVSRPAPYGAWSLPGKLRRLPSTGSASCYRQATWL